MRLFDQENKFWSFMGKLTDVACMSLLWLITSLPIVTIGASTTAFYKFCMRQVNDTEGTVVQSYFKGFFQHFKKATLLWLMNLAGIAFFAVDLLAAWNFYLNASIPIVGIVLLGLIGCFTIIFVGCTFYLYPTLAVFDHPIKKLLGNSFIMAMGNLPVTICMYLLLALGLYVFYNFSGFFFFIVGVYIFISSYLMFGVYRKYTGELAEEEALRKLQKQEKLLRNRMRDL